MPKLYMRYGSMKSSKTLQLISVKNSYEKQEKAVYCIKPLMDNRYGKDRIKSRMISKHIEADMVIDPDFPYEVLLRDVILIREASIVLADECQFMSNKNIEALRSLSERVPVIAYCLRADYRGYLFEGSKRLFELADNIEEIKNVCYHPECNRKATMNLRHDPTGPSVMLGDEEYSPSCYWHWESHMNKAQGREK